MTGRVVAHMKASPGLRFLYDLLSELHYECTLVPPDKDAQMRYDTILECVQYFERKEI